MTTDLSPSGIQRLLEICSDPNHKPSVYRDIAFMALRKLSEISDAEDRSRAADLRLVRAGAALASTWKSGFSEASRDRIAALEEALKPFAEAEASVSIKQDTQIIGTGGLLYGDLRKARAVLSGGNGE